MDSPTYFAAKALDLLPWSPQPDRKGVTRHGSSPLCWLCGGPAGAESWHRDEAISETSTKHSMARVPDSDAVCQGCVAMTTGSHFRELVDRRGLDVKTWVTVGWQNYSHLITPTSWECPRPSRWREILLDPPHSPWLAAVNPSGKKHVIPFATINGASRDGFPLQVEERRVFVVRSIFERILADFERLAELGFAKDDILSGRYHPESCRRAGLAAWREAEAPMAHWRDRHPDLLDLVHFVARSAKWFADQREGAGADPPPVLPPTPAEAPPTPIIFAANKRGQLELNL